MLFKAHKTSLVFPVKDRSRTQAFYSELPGGRFERRGEGEAMVPFARPSEDFDMDAGLTEKGVAIISPAGEAPMGKGADK